MAKKDIKDALQPVKAGNYRMMFVPKVDRAKDFVRKELNKDPEENLELVLVEYDRMGGLVLDKDGNKMPYKFFVDGKHLEKPKKSKKDD